MGQLFAPTKNECLYVTRDQAGLNELMLKIGSIVGITKPSGPLSVGNTDLNLLYVMCGMPFADALSPGMEIMFEGKKDLVKKAVQLTSNPYFQVTVMGVTFSI